MPKNIEHNSICSTCINAQNCTSLKRSDEPILFCEDFCIDIPPVTEDDKRESLPINNSCNIMDTNSKTFFGLCINCDNRKKCVFSNNEGGVWHCQEYQ